MKIVLALSASAFVAALAAVAVAANGVEQTITSNIQRQEFAQPYAGKPEFKTVQEIRQWARGKHAREIRAVFGQPIYAYDIGEHHIWQYDASTIAVIDDISGKLAMEIVFIFDASGYSSSVSYTAQ